MFLDPVTRDKVQPMLMFVGVQQFIDDKYIPASMVRFYSHGIYIDDVCACDFCGTCGTCYSRPPFSTNLNQVLVHLCKKEGGLERKQTASCMGNKLEIVF